MKKQKLLISVVAGLLAAIMLLSLILSMLPTRVSAASSSEIKNQIKDLKSEKNELQDQMEDLWSQYEENEDEIANMVNEKNILDQQVYLLYVQIDNINQQLAAYNLLIADKQDELDEAQSLLSELSAKNKERIRAMEEDGSISYWSVLFKANSFADLLDRLNMIEEIAAADQRRLREMSEAAEKVEQARQDLEAEKAELEEAQEELNATQTELDAKRTEAADILAELMAKGYEMEDLYAQYEQEEKDLLAEIAQMEKEYNEAKRQEYLAHMATATTVPPTTTAPPTTLPPETEATTGSTEGTSPTEGTVDTDTPPTESTGSTEPSTEPTTEPPTETTPPVSEGWIVPCAYNKLTSPFGEREAPTAGASTFHEGVDLSAPEGTPIYASRSGTVTGATYGRAAGYYVRINHGDGFSSIYMHMTHFVVKTGQTVSQGQLIGYVGSTGISTGNHLHFGISYNGAYVNPASYVNLY